MAQPAFLEDLLRIQVAQALLNNPHVVLVAGRTALLLLVEVMCTQMFRSIHKVAVLHTGAPSLRSSISHHCRQEVDIFSHNNLPFKRSSLHDPMGASLPKVHRSTTDHQDKSPVARLLRQVAMADLRHSHRVVFRHLLQVPNKEATPHRHLRKHFLPKEGHHLQVRPKPISFCSNVPVLGFAQPPNAPFPGSSNLNQG
ncbi:hypothetical protein DYB32_010457, partial [Aphanomyces invadans]